MEAAVGLVLDLVLYIFAAAFFLGLCLDVLTGSWRALKYCLGGCGVLFAVGTVIGLLLSGGLLIFLLFQLIILMLLFLFTLFLGGLCGSGIRRLRQDFNARKTLQPADLAEYLPLDEFTLLEDIDAERALARIRSGYYRGGKCAGQWYVHRAELTRGRT